jgi:2-methylisocitrate lyase-like PEP mutase family enzyme
MRKGDFGKGFGKKMAAVMRLVKEICQCGGVGIV